MIRPISNPANRAFFMVRLELDNTVFVEQKKILEQALSTNPKTQKALQKLIQQVITEAREKVMRDVHFDNGDPREARRSIRRTVYKKILGANLNIYNSRKAGRPTTYKPPRILDQNPHQRGGNRRPRSARTERMMSYGPNDRAMILRWVNSGTADRPTRFGNRGSIAARHWFIPSAEVALTRAADNLANLIDTELENILNKKK